MELKALRERAERDAIWNERAYNRKCQMNALFMEEPEPIRQSNPVASEYKLKQELKQMQAQFNYLQNKYNDLIKRRKPKKSRYIYYDKEEESPFG